MSSCNHCRNTQRCRSANCSRVGDLVCRVYVTVTQNRLQHAPDGTQSEQVQIATRGGDPAHVEVDCRHGRRCLRAGTLIVGRFRARSTPPSPYRTTSLSVTPLSSSETDYLTTEFGLDPPPQMQSVQRVQSQRHQRHSGIQRLDVVGPDHVGQQRKQDLFDSYTARKGARSPHRASRPVRHATPSPRRRVSYRPEGQKPPPHN